MMFKRFVTMFCLTLAITSAAPSLAYDPGTAGPLVWSPGDRLHRLCGGADIKSLPDECKLPSAWQAASQKEKAAVHIKRGLLLFQRMKLEEAGKEFAFAAAIAPSSFEAQFFAARHELGMLAMYLVPERLDNAERYLRNAERLAPTNVDVISTRAYVLWFSLRRADALELYEAVITADPRHVFARHQRAQINREAGKLELALADYDVLVSLEADNKAWRHARAGMHMRLGQHAQAAEDLSAYIAKDPYVRGVYILRATAYAMSGNTKAALKDLTAILNGLENGATFVLGGEKRAELLMKRSFLLLHLQEHDRAVADALEAASLGGKAKILRLQLFLKSRGLEVEINGKVSQAMRNAIKDCFGIEDCAIWMYRET